MGPTGKAVGSLPSGCRVPRVRGGGERDPAWMKLSVDSEISMEVQWREDGVRCKTLMASIADAHFQAMRGKRSGGGARSTEEEDDWLVNGKGLIRAMGRHGGHDSGLAQRKTKICDIGRRAGHPDGEMRQSWKVCHWPGSCTTRRM